MTVVSGAVGTYFGDLSGYMYDDRTLRGHLLGGAAGLVVGLGWCLLMIRAGDAARRKSRFGKLVLAPVAGGLAAGCVATIVLHLGMQLVHGYDEGLVEHLIGQAFGLVAGFCAGILGALVWPPVRESAPPA